MTCENCGHANPQSQTSFCEQCGATLGKRPTRAVVLMSGTLSAFAGVGVGILCTLAIWTAGTAAFAKVGLPSKEEFGVSQGTAWFYLATLVVTCCALVLLFVRPIFRRLDGGLRTFLLAVFFVMLGGMSLCNLFSSSSLFLKS